MGEPLGEAHSVCHGLLPVSMRINVRCLKVGNTFLPLAFSPHTLRQIGLYLRIYTLLYLYSNFRFYTNPLPSPTSTRFAEFWANLLANSIIKSNINQQISGLARTCQQQPLAQPNPSAQSSPLPTQVQSSNSIRPNPGRTSSHLASSQLERLGK